MKLPDVNVLVAASRPDHPSHPVASHWLTQAVRSGEPFALSSLALAATVRLVTNARIFVKPTELKAAFRFCDELRAHPYARMAEPGDRHWETFSRLCQSAGIKGPQVSDAWFAALAIEHGCEWITFDRDFSVFRELRWRLLT